MDLACTEYMGLLRLRHLRMPGMIEPTTREREIERESESVRDREREPERQEVRARWGSFAFCY